MDGPVSSVVGTWTEYTYRDPIYVQSLEPERTTVEDFGLLPLSYPCVRVTGTNGKGSTARFIAWTLEEAGYNVGLMSNVSSTRPIADTVQLNRTNIERAVFRELCEEVAAVAHPDTEPYGIRTVAALEWFERNDADAVVLEAGVGAQHDATNIVDASVQAITSVGTDHAEAMGGDITSVADDFAAAPEPETTLVIAPSCRETERITQQTDASHVVVAQNQFELRQRPRQLSYDCIVDGETHPTSLRASYHEMNINTAATVLDQLSLDTTRTNLLSVLEEFEFPGRAELLSTDPTVFLDGAHNVEGIRKVKETLDTLERPVTVVFSALEDKNWEEMIGLLQTVSRSVITTAPQDEKRADNAVALKQAGDTYRESPTAAVETARNETPQDGLVLVTGSLYMLKDVRPDLLEEVEERP